MILIIVKGSGTWIGAGLAVAMLAFAACGEAALPADGPLRIVTTTNIVGDLVENVTGDTAEVEVLIPQGADPHDYRPSARQVAGIRSADLIVAVGLGLEEGLADVLEAAREEGVMVLEIAPLLEPQPMATGGEGLDPHVWMDLDRMATAARLVADALAGIDPSPDWESRAEQYARRLLQADAEVRDILSRVPEGKRILITNHDSMGYFAARYGFEVAGTVIPGGSTLADPSSAELSELVDLIHTNGVPAIFAESTEPTELAEAVAAEVGRDVAVVGLFTGSLGPSGSEADSLIGLHLTNARRIAEALAC